MVRRIMVIKGDITGTRTDTIVNVAPYFWVVV